MSTIDSLLLGSDPDIEGGAVRGEFFVVRGVVAEAIVVTEGSLLIVDREGLSLVMQRLVPSAQRAINLYLNRA